MSLVQSMNDNNWFVFLSKHQVLQKTNDYSKCLFFSQSVSYQYLKYNLVVVLYHYTEVKVFNRKMSTESKGAVFFH